MALKGLITSCPEMQASVTRNICAELLFQVVNTDKCTVAQGSTKWHLCYFVVFLSVPTSVKSPGEALTLNLTIPLLSLTDLNTLEEILSIKDLLSKEPQARLRADHPDNYPNLDEDLIPGF